MHDAELIIDRKGTIFFPLVLDGIDWETEIKGAPGKLTFTVVKDQKISFAEGDPVRLRYKGKDIFYGFVFEKSRDREHHIKVTAYDQLRYLKNKDTLIYEKKTASDVLRMIAEDNHLQTGDIDDTGYAIPTCVEDGKTYFDMIGHALEMTMTAVKEMYILYDDFGKIALKKLGSLRASYIIDDAAGENFSYTSSIDGDTANQVKITVEDKEAGKRQVVIAKDSGHINDWGLLQTTEKAETIEEAKIKANALLALKNRKTRKLSFKGLFGDTSIRAGTLIVVRMNIGDMDLSRWMIAKRVKHSFFESHHSMDIDVIGGDGFV